MFRLFGLRLRQDPLLWGVSDKDTKNGGLVRRLTLQIMQGVFDDCHGLFAEEFSDSSILENRVSRLERHTLYIAEQNH